MKKLVLLIMIVSIFVIGCSPKLLRDQKGLNGHTDNVRYSITRQQDGTRLAVVSIPIRSQYDMQPLLNDETLQNKLPPSYEWKPGVHPYPYDHQLFSIITNWNKLDCHAQEKISCNARNDRSYGVSLQKERARENWLTIYIPYKFGIFHNLVGVISVRPEYTYAEWKGTIKRLAEMGVTNDMFLSVSTLYVSCSFKGCMLTDSEGKPVNEIQISSKVKIDEQKLAAAKAKEIKIKTKLYHEELAAKAREEQRRKHAWNAKVKRAYSSQTQQCLLLVDFINRASRNFAPGMETALQNAMDSFNKLECGNRVAEYEEVQMKARAAAYQQYYY